MDHLLFSLCYFSLCLFGLFVYYGYFDKRAIVHNPKVMNNNVNYSQSPRHTNASCCNEVGKVACRLRTEGLCHFQDGK